MTKQKNRDNRTFAAIVLAFATLVALFFLAPRVQNKETISSREVENILYKRVDEYNRAVREVPGMAEIVVTAETNPDELTEVDRQLYLTYQLKFFDGWEAAWNYNNAGYFDAGSWNKWNSRYIGEARLRPQFDWKENRKYFSGAFLQHVDQSVRNLE